MCGTIVVHVWNNCCTCVGNRCTCVWSIVVHVWNVRTIFVMSDQFLYLDKLAIHSTPKALQDDDDDSDDDEEGRKVPKEEREEHGSMGDIHVTYKITWTAGTVGGTLQAEADRLLQDLDGQQDEDLEEVPLLSVVAEASEAPEETKETQETIKTKEIKETKETSTAAAASTTYDSTAPQWWYVASDQYRTVMGPYTGTAMAGWLRGGYFNGQLNV